MRKGEGNKTGYLANFVAWKWAGAFMYQAFYALWQERKNKKKTGLIEQTRLANIPTDRKVAYGVAWQTRPDPGSRRNSIRTFHADRTWKVRSPDSGPR